MKLIPGISAARNGGPRTSAAAVHQPAMDGGAASRDWGRAEGGGHAGGGNFFVKFFEVMQRRREAVNRINAMSRQTSERMVREGGSVAQGSPMLRNSGVGNKGQIGESPASGGGGATSLFGPNTAFVLSGGAAHSGGGGVAGF